MREYAKQLRAMEKELYFSNMPSPYFSIPHAPKPKVIPEEQLIFNRKVNRRAKRQLKRDGFV